VRAKAEEDVRKEREKEEKQEKERAEALKRKIHRDREVLAMCKTSCVTYDTKPDDFLATVDFEAKELRPEYLRIFLIALVCTLIAGVGVIFSPWVGVVLPLVWGAALWRWDRLGRATGAVAVRHAFMRITEPEHDERLDVRPASWRNTPVAFSSLACKWQYGATWVDRYGRKVREDVIPLTVSLELVTQVYRTDNSLDRAALARISRDVQRISAVNVDRCDLLPYGADSAQLAMAFTLRDLSARRFYLQRQNFA